MHGDGDFAGIECLFEFLDEHTLVKYPFNLGHFAERNIGAAVAGGLDDVAHEGQIREGAGKEGLGGGGLDEGQFAAASADHEGRAARSIS